MQKRATLLISCILAVTGANCSEAPREVKSDWVEVGRGPDGTVGYVDRASLSREGSLIKAWAKSENKNGDTNGVVRQTWVALFDCQNRNLSRPF